MAGRILKHDVKTLTEVIADGGAASDLINDTQIYSSVLSKVLSQAIADGDIGGGSSGGFTFSNTGSNGALESFVLGFIPVFLFSNTDEQEIVAIAQVPFNYPGGVQIKLKNVSGVATSSGDVYLETRTYLFKNLQNISSLPTPHTFGSEVSLTANVLKFWPDFDLTDATGKINSISVAANDFLLIILRRRPSLETSSLNGEFHFMKHSSVPKFN